MQILYLYIVKLFIYIKKNLKIKYYFVTIKYYIIPMKNMRKNVATQAPTWPIVCIDINYDPNLLEKTYSNMLHSICDNLAKILYGKNLSQVLRTQPEISQKTIKLNENNKYTIIIPKNTGQKETNSNLLCKIKSMVQHAKNKGISMTIHEIK